MAEDALTGTGEVGEEGRPPESAPRQLPNPGAAEEAVSESEAPATTPLPAAAEPSESAHLPAAARPSTRSPVSPSLPAAVLLNLSGLGLGYLYLRRPLRWGIHLLVTVGLLAAACVSNGASRPWLWLAVWGAWLLWMAVDGGLQAARLRRTAPGQPAGRPWLPMLVGAAALALVAGGVAAYLLLGAREFAAARAAYQAADCRQAIHHMNWVTTFYELTLSPNVATADATIVECGLFVFAENAWKSAAYADAAVGYEAYLDAYPGGGLIPVAREQAAQVYRDWAAALRQEQEYETAIGKYRAIQQSYPDTSAGLQAAALAAETWAQWAGALQQAGQYEQAIARYRTVLAEFPETPTGQQAADLVARSYESWAAQLRQAGQYGEAIARYQVVRDEFPTTPVAAYTLTAETYWEWAAQLRQENEYRAALRKYEILLADYAGVYTTTQIRPAEAQTYADWSAYLRTRGLYGQAIDKYGSLAAAYPDAPEAAAVSMTVGAIYNEWGQDLTVDRKFTEAMEKFSLARLSTDDPAVVAAADAGYDSALQGLAADTDGDGRALLRQAQNNACQGWTTNSPAIGLWKDEPAKAVYSGYPFPESSIDDLLATMPGHLQYAICGTGSVETIQSCPYTSGYSLIRRREWWGIQVRDPRSGQVLYERTFWGGYPSACPFTYMFGGYVEYLDGNDPSSDDIAEWLRGIID